MKCTLARVVLYNNPIASRQVLSSDRPGTSITLRPYRYTWNSLLQDTQLRKTLNLAVHTFRHHCHIVRALM